MIVEKAMVSADEIDEKGLKKLHHLYGHTSAEKLSRFLVKTVPGTGVTETSEVISRAGKRSGRNRYWWNVKVLGTGKNKSINTEVMNNLQKIDSRVQQNDTVDALVVTIPRYLHDNPECVLAKKNELQNWDNFKVFQEVEDVGQHALNTSWVLVKKDEYVKARLCVRGDQEPNKEHIKTDSPTANKVNIKLFYVLAASYGWLVQTEDVKAAFRQGAPLERDVYVRLWVSRCRSSFLLGIGQSIAGIRLQSFCM